MFVREMIFNLKYMLALYNKNYVEVINLLNQRIKKYPDSPFYIQRLSEVCYDACDWETYREALEMYVSVLYGEIDVHYSTGLNYFLINEIELAIEQFDIAIELLEKNNSSLDNYSRVFSKKGICSLSLGKFDEALLFFDKALRINSTDIDANYGRLCCLYQTSRGNEILDELKNHNLHNAENNITNIWKALHLILYENKPQNGLSLLEDILSDSTYFQITKMDIDKSLYFNTFWEYSLILGKYLGFLAIHDAAKFAEIDIESIINYQIRDHYSKTMLRSLYCIYGKDYKRIQAIIKKELCKMNNPSVHADLSYLLAFSYLEDGDLSSASEIINEVMFAKPFTIGTKYLCGRILFEQRMFAKAALLFDQVSKNSFDDIELNIESLYYLGKTYVEINDYQNATASFRKILLNFPNNEKAKEMLVRCREMMPS